MTSFENSITFGNTMTDVLFKPKMLGNIKFNDALTPKLEKKILSLFATNVSLKKP